MNYVSFCLSSFVISAENQCVIGPLRILFFCFFLVALKIFFSLSMMCPSVGFLICDLMSFVSFEKFGAIIFSTNETAKSTRNSFMKT